MRREVLFMFISFSLFLGQLKAQNNVGIGTTTPHASALLDLTATDKGILIPRVALVAANNGTTPVNNPATGLLVYNTGTGGLTPAGFYYWNGTQWVQIGAGGGSSCVTLDGAYNCGGNGAGRTINAQYGSVQINVSAASSSTEALKASTANGTSSTPTIGVYGQHTAQYGVAIYGETTSPSNLYGAIQGSSAANNTNTSVFPSGVSGYFDGTGIGVGVWGETDANISGSGFGAGVYGYALGNKNFGGTFYSQSFPALDAEAGSSTAQTCQFVSAGADINNPVMLAVGRVQFTVSNATATAILLNNLAGQPTIAPSQGEGGFVGTSSVFWYQGYAEAWNALSRKELKRNFVSFEGGLYDLAMNDIRKMNPMFYKFKNEKDEFDPTQPSKTRFNYHMGFIIDEVPDYVKDNTFMAVDIYSLGALAIAGVKQVDKRVQQLETMGQVSDFGMATMQGNEIRIEYNEQFKNISLENVPVVTITPTTPNARYYIKSQDRNGFTLVSENGPMSFNWVAVARVSAKDVEVKVPAEVMSQIRVDEAKKKQMIDWANSLKQPELMQLYGSDVDRSQHRTLRIKSH